MDVQAAAAADALHQPAVRFRRRCELSSPDGTMPRRSSAPKNVSGSLVLLDDVGAVADEAELVRELGDETRVALEARAEHEADGRRRRFGDESLQRLAQRPVA